MDMGETKIEMKMVTNTPCDWFLDLSTAPGARVPFDKIGQKQVDCSFDGINYILLAQKGWLSTPENGALLRLKPQSNVITLKLWGIRNFVC